MVIITPFKPDFKAWLDFTQRFVMTPSSVALQEEEEEKYKQDLMVCNCVKGEEKAISMQLCDYVQQIVSCQEKVVMRRR